MQGIFSGIAVVVVACIWSHFSRRYPGWPGPATGLLIASAFIICELIIGTSGDLPRPTLLFFAIACALWLTGSIFDWNNFSYLMIPFSLAGIFLAVPDTEDVAILFGILIPAALFGWPLRQIPARNRRADAAALAAIVAWVITLDGQGRPASIVVSIGCLGLLALAPLLRLVGRSRLFSINRFPWIPILLHVLSISTALGLARTTPRMDLAAIAALVALGITMIAASTISKTYYIEEDQNQINNGKGQ